MVQLEIDGWVEEGKEATNVPTHCPKCGHKLQKTDALKLVNILFVWCPVTLMSGNCRWVEEYSL
jgi:NAD-dependent DNA ligase